MPTFSVIAAVLLIYKNQFYEDPSLLILISCVTIQFSAWHCVRIYTVYACIYCMLDGAALTGVATR